MLFSTLTAQTANAIAQTEQHIEDLQRQLKAANQQLGSLRQQQQAEKTAESAAEAALDMVKKAAQMIKAVCPSQVEVFEAALQEAIASAGVEAPALPTVEPEVVEEPGVEAEEVETVEVEAVAVEPEAVEPTGNGHGMASIEQLLELKVAPLKKLLKQKGIDLKGLEDQSRNGIAIALSGLVSKIEVDTVR
ncbi:MAG TPA: hypothetical protein V6C63_17745 [Allocoleopsis sp.]